MSKYEPEPTTSLSAETLIAMGYRKTSNSGRIVSRIDRPDFIEVMARHMHRAPADFFVPDSPTPAGNWCDHYRRCFSKDDLVVSRELLSKIPSSNFDPIGYVEI